MELIRAVIVDDDKRARHGLSQKLSIRHSASIEVLDMAKNVAEGVDLVNQLNPELLFLDMDMPDGTGFDLLNQIDHKPIVILITASRDYGIDALNRGVHHYITKPLANTALKEAILKVQDIILKRRESLLEDDSSDSITIDQKASSDVIILSNSDGHLRLQPHEVICCETEGMYSTFYLTDGSKVVITKSIKYAIELLPMQYFMRVAQSHIVNRSHVRQLDREGYLHLSNGKSIRISARLKSDIKKQLFS